MPKVIKIKRGLDINLKGKAEKLLVAAGRSQTVAVKPPDFMGLTPKLLVKPEQKVKVGTPLFFDKYKPSVLFVSPVAGTVVSVNRGERRRILEVVVSATGAEEYEPLLKGDPGSMEATAIKNQILKSGLWPCIIQRPYGVIANPDDQPVALFVSCFDTAPLAPDYEFLLKDDADAFSTGIAALRKMAGCKVHLGVEGERLPKPFAGLNDVEYHHFSGPHPAGNVGVQIHHVQPLNKGNVVWTLSPQHVVLIGKTFIKGHLDPTLTVAVAGPMVNKPRYIKTLIGTSLVPVLADLLAEGGQGARVISGNVLTGTRVDTDGYLGFYDSLISVIPEGDHYELFGWALPGIGKFSNSRTFFSWLTPKKEFVMDSNLNGGHRAFVMSGQYDKVLPMDIMPVHLLKSILVDDIDKMEQLGIYEVVEEDLALCEFVCTSKMEVQSILRRGLDLVRKEMS